MTLNLLTPDGGGFRIGSVTSRESSQYHQHANPSLLLAKQKASKVASSESLLSKSEDLDLVNKFNICFHYGQGAHFSGLLARYVQCCSIACC